jgi:poly(3-hydroxybutyrate) depolymerase
MLYQLHEMQRAAMEPWRWWAQANADAFGSPLSPMSYAPAAKNLTAGLDLMLRLTKRYGRPPFAITHVDVPGSSAQAQITEEVILDKSFCQLLHFKKSRAAKNQPTVLVFAPLSGHYSTLLRDTVRTMLSHHDIVITDWKDAREVPFTAGAFSFDDYVSYVQEFIRHMQKKVGGNIHIVSVCQPTVPVLAAVSLMAQKGETLPLSMTMMGGPIDARKSPTAVNDFATRKPLWWFEQNVIQRVPMKYPGAMRRVYPGFLQLSGFVAMNPEKHLESHQDYYKHLVEGDGESAETHRRFYDEYNAVMDLPAEYYLDTIVRVFQNQSLAKGELDVAGVRVTPSAIKNTSLFTIEGELDDISGSGQTEAAATLCTGLSAAKHQHYTAPGVGHYGIFSGRKYREMIYPKIREFIAKNNR